jgi:hypothetical protein
MERSILGTTGQSVIRHTGRPKKYRFLPVNHKVVYCGHVDAMAHLGAAFVTIKAKRGASSSSHVLIHRTQNSTGGPGHASFRGRARASA